MRSAVVLAAAATALLLPDAAGMSFAKRAKKMQRAKAAGGKAAEEAAAPTAEDLWNTILPLDRKAARRGGVTLPRTASAPAKAGGNAEKKLARASRDRLDSTFLNVDSGAFPKGAVQLQCFEPPVVTIDNFLSADACDALKANALDGKGEQVESKTFSASTAGHRTSTSWFLHFKDCQEIVEQALKMLPGVELQQLEEPQVVRYTLGQKFGWHGDALPKEMLEPGGSDGGQRVGTLLVYLNDVENGGATVFRDLGLDGAPLKVQPKKGRALLFFPSDNGGRPDGRTEHQAEPALDEKWICQIWIHEKHYPTALPEGNSNDPSVVFGEP